MYTKFWSENLKERDHAEDVDGKMMLEWIVGKVRSCGLDVTDSEWEPVAEFCEHSNEPSVSMKVGEFLN
jgi:hypothetical protein